MKGVGVAARSNNKQGQMIIDWSGVCCHVKVTKYPSFPRTRSEEIKGEQEGLGLDLRQHFLPGMIMGPFIQ